MSRTYQPSATLPPERLEKRRAQNRAGYVKRKSAHIATVKAWRVANAEKLDLYYKRYWDKNGERVRRERLEKRAMAYANAPKETWLKETFSAARNRARRRGITADTLIPALALPDICPVLGIPIRYHEVLGKHTPNSPSLDRIVPERGYVASNLRVISNRANTLKNNATVEEMRLVLRDMEKLQ